MKNKLVDLNNHLFTQLEKLNDDDLVGDKLQEEVSRTKAMTNVAKEIVSNGKLMLDARVSLRIKDTDSVTEVLGLDVKSE